MLDHENKLQSYLVKLRDSAVIVKVKDSLRKLLNAAATDEDPFAFVTKILKSSMASFSVDEQNILSEAFGSAKYTP
jgi:hypothetical protein